MSLSMSMSRPILACIHRPNSDPGFVGAALARRAIALDRRFIFGGDAKPDLNRYQGLIIFGGPQSANDDHPAIRHEHDLAEQALKKNMPLLGICLGAQIIARVLGGTVAPHAKQMIEAGFYPITPTQKGHKLFPRHLNAYQWHREGVSLPPCVPVLAQSDHFPVQAFQAGPAAYGLQFHPEVNFAMMHRWIYRDRKEDRRLEKPNARPPAQHYVDYLRYHRHVKLWLDRFLRTWLKGDAA